MLQQVSHFYIKEDKSLPYLSEDLLCHIHQHSSRCQGTILPQLQLHLGSLRCESETVRCHIQVSITNYMQ